ncbi:MAG TPA: hypothetical protein VGF55_15125 [Gemmataceae bacterium]|jgi:hypothetical protein
MSTKLHDFARQAILGGGLTPRTATSTVTGSAVDLITGDGRCFAVQQVGTVSGASPALAGKLQESADGSTGWADVAGVTFATVSSTDNVQAITFDRTQRYVRYVGTISGTSPSFALAVIVSEQKKQI